MIKSNGLANLEKSVRHGVWATHKLNEQKLNAAWGTCDNTLLLFSADNCGVMHGGQLGNNWPLRCASLTLPPSPLICSYKSTKSLCGAGVDVAA